MTRKICECCNHYFEAFSQSQIYCSRCGVLLKDLKTKLRYYKNKAEALNILIYGQRKGSGIANYSPRLKKCLSPAVKLAWKQGYNTGIKEQENKIRMLNIILKHQRKRERLNDKEDVKRLKDLKERSIKTEAELRRLL